MSFEKFVVVGCGRSGTRYASTLFTLMGIPCSHQRVFGAQADTQGWTWDTHQGDSSAFAAPVLKDLPDSMLIIHQVRNPWRVVLSLAQARHLPGQGTDKGTRCYERNTTDLLKHPAMHIRAAHLWWQWNLLVEQVSSRSSYFFHRVEDYSVGRLEHILKLLGRELTGEMQEAFKKLKTDVGSVRPKGRPPSFQEMPTGFWEMVNRYGYERPA